MLRYRALPMLLLPLVSPAVPSPSPAPESYFTLEERIAIVSFWGEPGRYQARPLGEEAGEGTWAARYTPEGSIWIRQLYRLRRDGKVIPTKTPEADNEQQRRWDAWVEARVARDRWLAQTDARARNTDQLGREPATEKPDEPPKPGPMPRRLAEAMSAPPAFYRATQPYAHDIQFDDVLIEYRDHVGVPHKYAYYRYEKGVRSFGTKVADRGPEYIQTLYERAGIPETEQRVFAAVSLLEGGFDSVNTYDTGYVSVGFIQFASLSGGSGSLGQVLLRMKTDFPDQFQNEFRRFGLEVTDEGVIVTMDPTTGAELVGPDANQRLIHDKRLIAVFQRAGQVSLEFNVSQVLIAREQYYPDEEEIVIEHGGTEMRCLVKDIFRSEAGMATLMDRKVNTGTLDPLAAYLHDLVKKTGITDLKDAAKYEWALTKAMEYRENYLDSPTLSQPERVELALALPDPPDGGG